MFLIIKFQIAWKSRNKKTFSRNNFRAKLTTKLTRRFSNKS